LYGRSVSFIFLASTMKHFFESDFGLVIAYLVPGAVALWGAGYLFEPIRNWFGASAEGSPTIGGFLYVSLGSIGAGLLVSAIRWAIVDKIYHATGIKEPNWNFSRLPGRVHAFEGLVENHYRYYQFYSNLLVALIFLFGAGLPFFNSSAAPGIALGFLGLAIILVLASRDALRKYYSRAAMVLQSQRGKR
jgi:hypothetical protein